ncbi:hypothetical protein L4D20_04660 [Vibrio kyushuensis]|uniref:hypothetical protein n=1 Tax=Vibrio kyushuensis TaxID=2910249 RepID=UPI003D0D34F0
MNNKYSASISPILTRICRVGFMLVILTFPNIVKALTIAELQNKNQLNVISYINVQEPVLASETIELIVEVSSSQRFFGKSELVDFYLPEASVFRHNGLFSVRAEGSGEGYRIIQQIRVLITPQSIGIIEIPIIELKVAVMTEERQRIEGSLYTSPVSFNVISPSTLISSTSWIAANELKITRQIDGKKEHYQLGDAITEKLVIQSVGIPSMVLPSFTPQEYPGLAVYVRSPSVIEHVVNNRFIATKEQEFIYTIEKSGHYSIPKRQWTHFDTLQREEHIITLESVTINTKLSLPQHIAIAIDTIRHHLFSYSSFYTVLAIFFIFLLIKFSDLKHLYINLKQVRAHRKKYIRAISRHDHMTILLHLYQRLDTLREAHISLDKEFATQPPFSHQLQSLQKVVFGHELNPTHIQRNVLIQMYNYLSPPNYWQRLKTRVQNLYRPLINYP